MGNDEKVQAEVLEFAEKFKYFLEKNPGFGINVVTTILHTNQGIGSQSLVQVCKLMEPPKLQRVITPT